MLSIILCPSCGARKISPVIRDLEGIVGERKYVVRNLRFLECASCGERVYDAEAMRRIEEISPAFEHRGRKRSA